MPAETLDRTRAVASTSGPQSPNGDPPVDPDGGQDRRVTVNLSVLTLAALSGISSLLDVNKTEAINRALRFYGEMTQLMADGGAVMSGARRQGTRADQDLLVAHLPRSALGPTLGAARPATAPNKRIL